MKNNFRSNILNALIKDPNLTQKQICAGAKITEATLSNTCNDNHKPRQKTIEKIKRYFNDNNITWVE
jgi:transcriptional regulator with XRE-family HTH domain